MDERGREGGREEGMSAGVAMKGNSLADIRFDRREGEGRIVECSTYHVQSRLLSAGQGNFHTI